MSSGFVLIRYGETHTHGNECHEEGSYYTHKSIETEDMTSHVGGHAGKHQGWSGDRESWEKNVSKRCYCGVCGKEQLGQGQQV